MSISSNFPSIRPSLNLNFAKNKTLDPRIAFSRASTATYYDGVTTAKAEENLVLPSQAFSGWSNSNVTVSDNSAVAPDGTTTATTLTDNTVNDAHGVYKSSGNNIPANTIYTVSCFVKAGTNSYVALAMESTSSLKASVVFDLSNGTVGQTTIGSSTTLIGSGITAIGSAGWYRIYFSYSINTTAAMYFNIQHASAATGNTLNSIGDVTYAGTGKTIFLWGAQLEQRSALTAYTPTTTQPITNYIPVLKTASANVARFTHNPVTRESLGLLIEEQRTNLQTYSSDATAWNKTSLTVVSNTVVAPDGTLTGDKLVEDSDTNKEHYVITPSTTASASTAYTGSVYVKRSGRDYVQVRLWGSTSFQYVIGNFNLVTGQIVGSLIPYLMTNESYSITNVGNDWYRISITGTTTASIATLSLMILPATSSNTSNNALYDGNGYSGICIWGAQLEAGSFVTSYIPTVASSVTRSNDAATMTGTNFSSWYRADEGVLYAEAQINGNTPTITNMIAQVTQSGNGDPKAMSLSFSSSGRLRGVITTGFDTATSGQTYSINTFYKMAIGYKKLDYAGVFTGAIASTNTSSTLLTDNPAVLTIGGFWWNGGKLNGTIKCITYYPSRLTNTQLQALTS